MRCRAPTTCRPSTSTLIERPTAANPLGVKGSGQAGCIAAPQTVMAAILDALRPAGVEALDMPATPERVWQALRRARRSGRHRTGEKSTYQLLGWT